MYLYMMGCSKFNLCPTADHSQNKKTEDVSSDSYCEFLTAIFHYGMSFYEVNAAAFQKSHLHPIIRP